MHVAASTGRMVAGRYLLQNTIGRGAMGTVWRARDTLLARDVAVKEVRLRGPVTAGSVMTEETRILYQRTLREARTAARLNHPAVVTVFDVVEADGSPWIVMELVQARSLDQVLTEDGPLRPEQAADLGLRVLEGLACAHAAGILHRDVKPSNVLLGPDDRAVLTDFGIATLEGDTGLTQAGMVMGTPGFTAPERIRGDAASPASDLWSLGATLYAAVEGRGPFDDRGNSIAILAAIANEEPPRPRSAGPLGPVIEGLLRRDPQARPDAAAVGRLLASAGTSGGVRASRDASRRAAGDPLLAAPVDLAMARPETQGPAGGRFRPEATRHEAPQREAAQPEASQREAAQREAGWPDGPWAGPEDPWPGSPWPESPPSSAPPSSTPPSSAPSDSRWAASVWAASAWAEGPWAGDRPAPSDAPWASRVPPPENPPAAGPPAAGRPTSGPVAAGPSAAGRPTVGPLPGRHGAPASAAPRRVAAELAAMRPRGPHGLLAILGALAIVGTGILAGMALTHRGSGSAAPASSQAAVASQAESAAGFSMTVPAGWQTTRRGSGTSLTSPSGDASILVTPTAAGGDQPRAQGRRELAQVRQQGNFPGYQPIGRRPFSSHGRVGVTWEFTWQPTSGARIEVRDIAFRVATPGGSRDYLIRESAPARAWPATQSVFRQALSTLRARS